MTGRFATSERKGVCTWHLDRNRLTEANAQDSPCCRQRRPVAARLTNHVHACSGRDAMYTQAKRLVGLLISAVLTRRAGSLQGVVAAVTLPLQAKYLHTSL